MIYARIGQIRLWKVIKTRDSLVYRTRKDIYEALSARCHIPERRIRHFDNEGKRLWVLIGGHVPLVAAISDGKKPRRKSTVVRSTGHGIFRGLEGLLAVGSHIASQ